MRYEAGFLVICEYYNKKNFRNARNKTCTRKKCILSVFKFFGPWVKIDENLGITRLECIVYMCKIS